MKRKTQKEKKSLPGRTLYSMYARTSPWEIWIKYKGNYQFRSRTKKSKKENNRLERKDWILKKKHYTVSTLNEDVLKMETGLATWDVFNIVVSYTERVKDQINYFAGWRVTSIRFWRPNIYYINGVRQNYTNLHLAKLFICSVSTIANIVTTFIRAIHSIYWPHDINPF